MMTVGGCDAKLNPDIFAAQHFDQFVADDLDDLLARTQALQHFLADRLRPHRIGELLDDLEIHVGFEQRDADFLQGFVDVLLGEPAFAAKIFEDALQFFG